MAASMVAKTPYTANGSWGPGVPGGTEKGQEAARGKSTVLRVLVPVSVLLLKLAMHAQ